ncbi:MAG: SDR family oxidoreductase [Candidatus Obscuribacterales bacterium]|nr:SDR family oxidoreductase [Candidatus Obscuribacterales bacterium]
MPINSTRKVAIVTGASRGIGADIACELAKSGMNVVINYVSNAAKAHEVVDRVKQCNVDGIAVQADVSIGKDVARLFAETIAQFGQVDYLINNAGVILYKFIEETSEEEYDQLFNINVKGTFLCCQQAIKHLSDGGAIINFSTSLTAMMLPRYGAYVASKGAVEQLSRTLSRELADRKIRVNVVSPGPTDTELFMQDKTPEQVTALVNMVPLKRLGKPDDIATVVAFLVSDEGYWINGQNIRVNGGIV